MQYKVTITIHFNYILRVFYYMDEKHYYRVDDNISGYNILTLF